MSLDGWHELGEVGAIWEGEAATRAGAASAATPLPFDSTTGHIPPQEDAAYRLFVPLGGSMCKLKGINAGATPPKPGKKEKISEFNRRSRRRLLQLLASLDRDTRPPLFLGLTYPGEHWPADPAIWHEHLEHFHKRLCRKYPMCDISIVWRLEPQHRGAPHYHLLVFGVPYIPYQWVGEVWAAITDGNAATCSRVERIRSWKGAMSYASKYLGKAGKGEVFTTEDGEELGEVGRHWGVKGRKYLPATWVAYVLLQHEFHQVRRQLARYVRSKGRRHQVRGRHSGLWCFMQGEDAIRLIGHYARDADMLYEAPTL